MLDVDEGNTHEVAYWPLGMGSPLGDSGSVWCSPQLLVILFVLFAKPQRPPSFPLISLNFNNVLSFLL